MADGAKKRLGGGRAGSKIDRIKNSERVQESFAHAGANLQRPRRDDTHYVDEIVPLTSVYLQKDNPRWRGSRAPTLEEIVAWPEVEFPDITDPKEQQRMLRRIEHIRQLASSIKKERLAQPPTAVREGVGYRLLDGDNRVLACRFLGETSIPLRVRVADKARGVISHQFIMNKIREDWDLVGTLTALRDLLQEADLEPTGANIEEVAHLTRTLAYKWAAVLAVPEVVDAIITRKIETFELAYQIAMLPLRSDREKAISEGSVAVIEPTGIETKQQPKQKPASRRGKPKSTVNLGRVKSPDLMMVLLAGVAKQVNEAVPEIDPELQGSDRLEALEKAWRHLLEQIESKVQ